MSRDFGPCRAISTRMSAPSLGSRRLRRMTSAADRHALRALAIHRTLAVFDCVQPGPIFIIIGGVDHHQEFLRSSPVYQRIIDHVRVRVKKCVYRDSPTARPADVIAASRCPGRRLHPVLRPGTRPCGLRRTIRQPGGSQMLIHERRYTKRASPSRQRDDLGAQLRWVS